jgi:hypothetical protein
MKFPIVGILRSLYSRNCLWSVQFTEDQTCFVFDFRFRFVFLNSLRNLEDTRCKFGPFLCLTCLCYPEIKLLRMPRVNDIMCLHTLD